MTTSPRLLSASLLAALAAMALPAHAAELTLTVTTLADNYNDPVPGSLRAAINTANANPGDSYVINFNVPGGGTLRLGEQGTGAGLAAMLPILTNPQGIRIDGANGGQGAITINGGSTGASTGDRIFFVGVPDGTPAAAGGTLASTANTRYSISNLALQTGNARGGNGGNGGGGGAGLGGAIFVNAGNLTISGVTFANNRATGGNGGTGSFSNAATSAGGGGGMGGNGGTGNGAGGGGFGRGADGGTTANLSATELPGRSGVFTGAAGGGQPSSFDLGGAQGGGGAGNGISLLFGGGGGVSGSAGADASAGVLATGGAGGFGGGGGSGNNNRGGAGSVGGNGGFGGGGGSSASNLGASKGGNGGFGGGGGGARSGTATAAGLGGFGGASGLRSTTVASGGGGAGLGGAIFIRQGASVTLIDGGLSGGTASGGSGGGSGGLKAGNGSGIGSGIFLAGSVTYTVSANNTVTMADTIGGGLDAQISGGFTKSGDGTLVLSGANTHVGGTTVSAGTLLANNTSGSGTGTGNVVVNGSGTFGGTGAIDGSITVDAGGTLAPGASIESLASGSVSLTDASASFSAEVDVELPAADLLSVTGSVSLGGSTLKLSAANLTALGGGHMTFLLLANDGADVITGSFGDIACLGCTATVDYAFTGTDALGRIGDGNDLAVTVSRSLAPVPEPGTWALMAAGLLGLGAAMRSRQRR